MSGFEKMSAAEFKKAAKKPYKSKYRNTKVKSGDMTFDSRKEYERWLSLNLLMANHVITDLRRQVRYNLTWNEVKICAYVADFVYTHNGSEIVEDVKSDVTRKLPVYVMKKKMMEAAYGIIIKEI